MAIWDPPRVGPGKPTIGDEWAFHRCRLLDNGRNIPKREQEFGMWSKSETPKSTPGVNIDAAQQAASDPLEARRQAFEAHLQRLRAEIATTNAELTVQLDRIERSRHKRQMYAEIRRYSGHGVDALFDLIEELRSEVESLMQTIPGFVSYSLIRTEGGGAAFTICNDKAGADQSARIAHDWIASNAGDLGTHEPEIFEGRVVVHLT